MKQLLSLFLLLLPYLVLAQYPSNGNQKITLGEQTTADGLIWRGVASIDTVTATSKITRANKQDTSAYLLLDTVTNLLWHYKIGSNGWSQAGGSTFDTTTLNLVSRFAAKLNISDTASMLTPYIERGDTASMLTPYWRSGRFSGVLPLLNGGTGSATQNFVDLTNTQTVGGVKTFTDTIIVNKGIRFPAIQSASTNVNTLDDYEEGIWETTFGAKGNLTGTPILSAAIYRKVGQLVYIEGKIAGLSITTSNTNTYIVISVPISMNANSTSQVGNVYSYIGSINMTGVITDNTSGDNTTVAIIIPNALVTAGNLGDLLFSITYIANN